MISGEHYTMFLKAKGYIKTLPRIYDWMNALRAPESELEHWLDDFSRTHPGLRFIQIGASDGLRWDPFRKFIVRDQWQGMLVEPLPDVFQLLKKNYGYLAGQGLSFVNAAITDKDGQLTLWTWTPAFLASLDTEERFFLQRLASFNRDQIIRSLPEGLQYTVDYMVPVIVQAMTIGTLITNYWPYKNLAQWPHASLDLVTVDAEGHDDTIVLSMPLDTFKPKAIIFEAHNLGEERRTKVFAWLNDHGYDVRLYRGDAVASQQRLLIRRDG